MNHCNDSAPCSDLDWTIKSYLILSYIYINIYIYIKSMGIYQPENLMSNGSSRHDDAAPDYLVSGNYTILSLQ